MKKGKFQSRMLPRGEGGTETTLCLVFSFLTFFTYTFCAWGGGENKTKKQIHRPSPNPDLRPLASFPMVVRGFLLIPSSHSPPLPFPPPFPPPRPSQPANLKRGPLYPPLYCPLFLTRSFPLFLNAQGIFGRGVRGGFNEKILKFLEFLDMLGLGYWDGWIEKRERGNVG